MKPKNSGAEVSSTLKAKSGGILIELGPETTSKSTFCEAVKGILGEKVPIPRLEPMCYLEIRDPDSLIKKVEVDDAIKHECSNLTNVQIGITSVNVQGQKLAVVEVLEQYFEETP